MMMMMPLLRINSVIILLLTTALVLTITTAFVPSSHLPLLQRIRAVPTVTTTTTQLFYTSPSSSSSSSSSSSDHERFRKTIAAAAGSMYYQSEMTIQELEQARATFEQLLHCHSEFYTSSDSSSRANGDGALEVYYPEGVIHGPSSYDTVTTTRSQNQPPQHSPNDARMDNSNSYYDEHYDDHYDDDDQNLRLLTSAGRRLRELEIQLLESLRDNDDGVDQLVHLWTTERNAESAHALLQMQTNDQPCSVGLVQEEAALAELCRSYPGWAEPWSRLATLLFYKGIPRWSDALSAAEEAIRIKPWHFEALNVCSLILAQMDHPENPSVIFGDDDSVEDLRRRCYRLSRLALPKLDTRTKDHLEARQVWVARAVATAQHQLQCAEQYTTARKRSSRSSSSTASETHPKRHAAVVSPSTATRNSIPNDDLLVWQ
jgi:hypothetical protein